MKVMTANIKINDFSFDRISSVQIESSWDLLTDTAEVTIPRALYFASEILKDKIKVGDSITIELGYNGANNVEFEGYVTKITTDTPVVISCEDAMWKLKQKSVNKVFKKISLQDLLSEIVTDFDTAAADLQLGTLVIENSTVAKVLQALKDDYGIYSYFKGNTLVSGKIYLDNTEQVEYGFEKNIISHDLKYVNADDLKIKITAESIKHDGTKLTVSVGDDDGEESKLVYSGIDTQSELKKLAELDLARLKVDGYEGTITTFGVPYVQHGYTAYLESNQYPERAGYYYIDSVSTTFNNSGFRRTLKIGGRASEQI